MPFGATAPEPSSISAVLPSAFKTYDRSCSKMPKGGSCSAIESTQFLNASFRSLTCKGRYTDNSVTERVKFLSVADACAKGSGLYCLNPSNLRPQLWVERYLKLSLLRCSEYSTSSTSWHSTIIRYRRGSGGRLGSCIGRFLSSKSLTEACRAGAPPSLSTTSGGHNILQSSPQQRSASHQSLIDFKVLLEAISWTEYIRRNRQKPKRVPPDE